MKKAIYLMLTFCGMCLLGKAQAVNEKERQEAIDRIERHAETYENKGDVEGIRDSKEAVKDIKEAKSDKEVREREVKYNKGITEVKKAPVKAKPKKTKPQKTEPKKEKQKEEIPARQDTNTK